MGGAAIVIDIGAARRVGGVKGVAWSATEVVGATPGGGGLKSIKQVMKQRHRS
jgi:hypothetical protein